MSKKPLPLIPVSARQARTLRDLRPWPSLPWTCAGPGTMPPTRCGAARPGAVGAHPQPLGRPADRVREKLQSVLARARSARRLTIWCRGGARRRSRARGSRQAHPQSRADLRRLLQHGVHVERGPADLLGRPGQRGRRSAQGRQRPGRAGRRRGPALQPGLFPPGDRQGRRAAGALSRTTTPGSCRSRRCARPNGEWLRLEIALPGYSVWLRAWQVQVGRVKLYLLDSNDAANHPVHRGITSELYGGGPELRLQQEMLLGIGGWRLLRALGISRRSAI